MHMVDALISPVVGASMYAISTGTLVYSISKIKTDEFYEKKIPIMAITGAFIFAAQMINFTIPFTGSSGHIGGGILLATLLGSFNSFLTLSIVIIIQALFFADGGLFALGCNIFNMAAIPCLIVYPIFFRLFLKNNMSLRKLSLASIFSSIVSLQLGALSIVLQTLFSGISTIPFFNFLLLMQPIHFLIGIIEGLITASILCLVYKMQPEIIITNNNLEYGKKKNKMRIIFLFIVVLMFVSGILLSSSASSKPDGLEWSINSILGEKEIETDGLIYNMAENLQQKTSVMPNYEYKNNKIKIDEKPFASILGGAIIFALAILTSLIIRVIINLNKNKVS